MPPYLQVIGVSKSYGNVRALEKVSLTVNRGEIVSLLGPNGAGKTTLLKIIVGVLAPDEGEVLIDGRDVWASLDVKAKIGYLPQENILYKSLNAYENLLFYALLYGLSRREAKSRISELIVKLGMEEYAKRLVRTYSGGMKKRLSIAATIIHEPELLVLDEPTTGLDPHVRREIWSLIKEQRGKGRAILLATHYMEEAEELSDRVYIIDKGKVIAHGTPEELKKKYGDETVVELEVKNPSEKLREALARYSSSGRVVVDENVYRVYVREYEEILPKLVEEAIRVGAKPVSTRLREPTLEDVFIKLTGRRLE